MVSVSVATAARFAFSIGMVLFREVSWFSEPAPPSAPVFGVTPERGKDRVSSGSRVERRKDKPTYNATHPPASSTARIRTRASPVRQARLQAPPRRLYMPRL